MKKVNFGRAGYYSPAKVPRGVKKYPPRFTNTAVKTEWRMI
jgi:hypothetical protein